MILFNKSLICLQVLVVLYLIIYLLSFALGVAIGLAGGDGVAAIAAFVGFIILNKTMGHSCM